MAFWIRGKEGIMLLDRYYLRSLQNPFPKLLKPQKRISKDHLAWVRRRLCVVSGFGDPVAHHVLRKSQTENDYATIALTPAIHGELHQMGVDSFERMYAVDSKDALIATLIDRVQELEEQAKE